MPPKINQIIVRPFSSKQDQENAERKNAIGWGGTLRPDSVLVCAMGSHWAPAAWAKTMDMVNHTNKVGVYCGFMEIMDRCLTPLDAMGTMRNEAIMHARIGGFEWLCYVDNDVLPEPDTLVKLISHQLPVMAPFVVEPGTGKRLHGPEQQPDTGIHAMKWTALSFLLFHTNVFNAVGPQFWADAIGADEGIHFQRLWYYGHRLYMDTGVQLMTVSRPNYPLTIRGLTKEEREARYEATMQRLREPPNRSALNPADVSHMFNGIYMPMIEQKPAGTSIEGTVTEPTLLPEVRPI